MMTYARRVVRWLARIGYAARGLVYVAVGVIAVMAAFSQARARDVHGTMAAFQNIPGGRIMLGAIAAGLLAYAVWRLVQTVLDVDQHGHGPMALCIRMALLISAMIYTTLAWGCVQIILYSSDGGGQPMQSGVSALLKWPWGSWLVIAGGIAIGGAGAAHLAKAVRGGFWRWFDAPSGSEWIIDPVSRFGLSARGLLFLVIAGFVIYSALTLDPSQARGMHGVLVWSRDHIYGRILLGAIGVGLVAFGGYSLIEAVVRRVGLGKKPLKVT